MPLVDVTISADRTRGQIRTTIHEVREVTVDYAKRQAVSGAPTSTTISSDTKR